MCRLFVADLRKAAEEALADLRYLMSPGPHYAKYRVYQTIDKLADALKKTDA